MPYSYMPKMCQNTLTYKDELFYNYTTGVICPCSPTKTFYKKSSFENHVKCKRHRKWLDHLNENSVNYYKKCLEYEKIIKEQKIILTNLENKLKQKDVIIEYLESNKK